MRKTGFTMIEFLVVAALIAILATLGMGAFARSMARGRDAKRVSDMKEIQKMYELYYSLNNSYNADCNLMFTDQTGKLPSPPTGTLVYFGNCTATGYRYCSRLENGTDYGNATCSEDTASATCDFVDADQTHYCVTNVQ